MDLQLRNKRAIVTGGSRGIGFAVAEALAVEGADVAIVSRGVEALQEAAGKLSVHGGRVVAVAADTIDDEAVRDMVASVVAELGGVDILVNSAAQPASSGATPTLATLTDEAIHRELDTKLVGYLRCARAVAPHMQAAGWGRIISISGLNARQAGSISGSVRNVAVAAMTKNIADELGPYGINCTVVHPGSTLTERTPGMLQARADEKGVTPQEIEAAMVAPISIGRMVTAAEVAAVVTFLASPRSVAINGDAIAVGGGTKGAIHY
ncbi:SDR family oxidoreductase [Acidothermaceae bacterium B102]|nr:SDR family oxidoreductase [Acidothermaceae bacterium B102]